MGKIKKSFLLLGSSFLLLACQSLKTQNAGFQKEITNASVSTRATVALGKIDSQIPPGESVGGWRDEFGNFVGESWKAPDGFSLELQKRMGEILSQSFSQLGVSFLTRNAAFGRDDSANSNWILHLSLVSLRQEMEKGEKRLPASCSLVFDWQLLARRSGEQMHQATSSGEGKGENSLEAQILAFRMAAENFLSQPFTKKLLTQAEFAAKEASHSKEFAQAMNIPHFLATDSSKEKSENSLLEKSDAVFSLRTMHGLGSGFFIREDGLALTAAHLVAGRKYWDGVLGDGKTVRFRVIRENTEFDLALLQATEGQYPILFLANSGSLQIGQELYSIGTPVYLSLQQTAMRGIVSALRTQRSCTWIQTDLPMNPGCSGAPLLDSSGLVIGLILRKLNAPDVDGIGFAISSNDICRVLDLRFQTKP